MVESSAPPQDPRLVAAQRLLDMATEARSSSARWPGVNGYLSMVAEWALVGMAHEVLRAAGLGIPDWQEGRWVVCPKEATHV